MKNEISNDIEEQNHHETLKKIPGPAMNPCDPIETSSVDEFRNEDSPSYYPIENYGIIGNLRTAALIRRDASIDWFCFPHFDSPAIFARLLDCQKGGFFHIFPLLAGQRLKQLYLPNTNILVSRFLSEEGVSQVTDLMPLSKNAKTHWPWIVRLVECVRGEVTFRAECFPAFDYARRGHTTQILSSKPIENRTQLMFHQCPSGDESVRESERLTGEMYTRNQLPSQFVRFSADRNLEFDLSYVNCKGEQEDEPLEWKIEERDGLMSSGATATFRLKEGQRAYVVARFACNDENSLDCQIFVSEQVCDSLFRQTLRYWHTWASKCTYRGRWREPVLRSALVLKLMTFEPSGAIVASPSCSLPGGLGGPRNWDYRYSWIRDSAFTLYAFMRIGFTEEAIAYMKWIEERCKELRPDGSLQIMYGIDGRHELREEALNHLEGYRKSQPIRIGNSAYDQLQLDIYGELMDAVYLYNKYCTPVSFDFWCHLRKLLNYVCDNWNRKDYGIWEVRGGAQHFVYSKVMCWVALDRGVRLADRRSFPSDRHRWIAVRDQIYEDIMALGWSDRMQAFQQSYGKETLDASNLIMPLVFFLSPSDPRMLSTLRAIRKSPENGGLVANNLCFRYNVETTGDGLTGEEGTFSICSFWLVEAMARAGRYDEKILEEALVMFEQVVGYSNHLGLYSEQIAKTGQSFGNFPQAFTHLSLISAAFNLDRILG